MTDEVNLADILPPGTLDGMTPKQINTAMDLACRELGGQWFRLDDSLIRTSPKNVAAAILVVLQRIPKEPIGFDTLHEKHLPTVPRAVFDAAIEMLSAP